MVKYRDKVAQMNKKKGLGLQKCEQDIYKNYRGRWSKNLEN
jgi:endonuclease YncB( thermonuclease family)